MKTVLDYIQLLTESHDSDDHVERHWDKKVGKATLSYEVNHTKKEVHITSIRVAQAHRKQGHGQAALKHATDHADKLGYKSRLEASPLDKKTHPGKLVHMYKKHGFKETGRRINSAGDPEMEREPSK
jgi:ribosomal protein S18 acetylase RimI-like enzyme